MNDDLKRQILGIRNMSADNKLVTYDLRLGVDFSHPRKTAEALSDIFFQEDASKWFEVDEDKMDFKPDYRAEIILTTDHDRKIKASVDDFRKDLRKDEFKSKYEKQIEASVQNYGIGAYMFMGLTGVMLMQHSDRMHFIQELYDKVMSNTTIKYVDEGTR